MSNSELQVKKVICRFCHHQCRLLAYTEDDHLVKLEVDRSLPGWDLVAPPTAACVRLRAAKEIMYHPDKVNFPLKRAAEKGRAKWQRISWEQAFDEIATKLKQIKEKYGAEAISFSDGTARTNEEWIRRFFNLLGTPNQHGANSICHGPRCAIGITMLGWVPQLAYFNQEGLAKSKCILLIGEDPSEAHAKLYSVCKRAKNLGITLIVVDPRRTATAALADIWLQIRPHTDTALLMSMINIIIEEELYDKEFVANWCYGFEQLVKRAREYPADKVAEICNIPAEQIREAARTYATNKPAFSDQGMGLQHQSSAISAIQCAFILAAITGNVDVNGGEMLPGPSQLVPVSEIELNDMLPPEQKEKQLGSDRFKLLALPGWDLIQPNVKSVWGTACSGSWGQALAHAPTVYRSMLTGKPYPVRACITLGSNPMITQPNVKLIYKALKSLDLYVVLDYWLTPSAELADYVLPVASWLERPHLIDGLGIDPSFHGGEAALPTTIAGEYDHRTDYDILRGLAIRLGQGEYWPWSNLEEAFNYRLKPTGMTFKEFMAKGGSSSPTNVEFKKYEKTGFGTPTGKIELYSTILEKLGYDPLPAYKEGHENPISAPELAKEYPLTLITGGRFRPMFHSEYRQIDSIRRRRPHPLVQINPETASKLDIQDGDWVWIESPRGRIRMKAQLFSGIDPSVVHAEHGWWFPELPGEEPWLHGVWESNANVLTNDEPDICDPMGGGWPLKLSLCKVYKAKVY